VLTEAVPPDEAPTLRAVLAASPGSAAAAAPGAAAALTASAIAGPSRRAVLAASAAALPLLLAACKGVQALGTPPPPAPDIVALRAAISAEAAMVAKYEAALRRIRREFPAGKVPPGGVTLLSAIATVHFEHAAHLARLKLRLVQPVGSAPAPSTSASQSPSPGPTAPSAGSVAAQVTALAVAEQAASDRLIGQLGGLPPSLAQLFASIAASEATHVPYLQAAGRGR
jgi:hypothetical protein